MIFMMSYENSFKEYYWFIFDFYKTITYLSYFQNFRRDKKDIIFIIKKLIYNNIGYIDHFKNLYS